MLFAASLTHCARPASHPTASAEPSVLDQQHALAAVVCEQPELPAEELSARTLPPRDEALSESQRALDRVSSAHLSIVRLHSLALRAEGRDEVVRCLNDKLVRAQAELCFVRSHHALLRYAVATENTPQTRYEQALVRIGRSRSEALLFAADTCTGTRSE